MGGSLIKLNKKRKNSLNLWTENEKNEINKSKEIFQKILNYIVEYYYYNIPVIITHQTIDPLSPLWVKPDTEKVMKRVDAFEQIELQKDWVNKRIY